MPRYDPSPLLPPPKMLSLTPKMLREGVRLSIFEGRGVSGNPCLTGDKIELSCHQGHPDGVLAVGAWGAFPKHSPVCGVPAVTHTGRGAVHVVLGHCPFPGPFLLPPCFGFLPLKTM